jgi:phosphatidylethanolamine/phosphatidyl-N-methylethanolamine N-methyltransferase
MSRLNADAVRTAYRRQASFYDLAFGSVSVWARRRAVAAVNALPGECVLEVGVGTGLALPHYSPDRRITGIDLSADMLDRARARVASLGLENVEALLELDAEATGLPAASFDIAVAMFVASVVPHPKLLLAELRRLVRPGGHILFANHFSAPGGVRLAIERGLVPLSHALGWHPDFAFAELLDPTALAAARITALPPAGLFTLVQLPRL